MTEPKRLTRDSEHAVIAGVCVGIANYFSVDPVLVRLIAVLLTFSFGGGLVAYIVAWIIMPVGDNKKQS